MPGSSRTPIGSTAGVLDRFMTRYPTAIFDVGHLKPEELKPEPPRIAIGERPGAVEWRNAPPPLAASPARKAQPRFVGAASRTGNPMRRSAAGIVQTALALLTGGSRADEKTRRTGLTSCSAATSKIIRSF